MREIVHLQAGQCGNQIGAKVGTLQAFKSLTFDQVQQYDLFKHKICDNAILYLNIFQIVPEKITLGKFENVMYWIENNVAPFLVGSIFVWRNISHPP